MVFRDLLRHFIYDVIFECTIARMVQNEIAIIRAVLNMSRRHLGAALIIGLWTYFMTSRHDFF